jgi:FtsP/CotA-like multicopper oxidase with cupredoxin domain
LPHTHGVDDFPLILQDYFFGGRLGEPAQPGRRGAPGQGGLTLVNGSLEPVLATEQPRLRLRLLNASDQRIYALGFAGDVLFHQVASDGGLLPAPVRLTRLQLGVAERAEIIVDLADAPLALQRFGGIGRDGNAVNTAQSVTLMTIRGPGEQAARAAGLPPLPVQLNSIERFDPASAAVTREMVLGGGRAGRTINGHSMASTAHLHDMASALRVRLDDLERWNVVNASRETHIFHIHDVQFQILERNGAAPGPAELGRKDTVLVRPGETVPLLMRFEDYADAEAPYMFHCHILQHEDQGMMGQFVVVPA